MKIGIVYASKHHENTFKLIKAVSEKFSADLISAEGEEKIDLSEYDLIGFASGVVYGKFYESVTKALEKFLPEGKKVFFVYTCGKNSKDFSEPLKAIAESKKCSVLGAYGCKGYDTYGPFKLIGGINKNHPDERDIQGILEFVEKIKA